MNFWTGLILGIIIGWLVEWIIDWLFWRRDAAAARDEASLTQWQQVSQLDANLEAQWQGRLATAEEEYEARLAAVEAEWQARLELNEQQWQDQFAAVEADRTDMRARLADTAAGATLAAAGVAVAYDAGTGEDEAAEWPADEFAAAADVEMALAAEELAAAGEFPSGDAALSEEWPAAALGVAGVKTADSWDVAAGDAFSVEAEDHFDTREFPPVLSAAAGADLARRDDLTRVRGIGPKYATLLAENGIITFEDLAAADAERLRAIVQPGPMQQINFGSWSAQAGAFAAARGAQTGDDLTVLEGIGPVYATRLRERGITTFAELAASDETTLAGIIAAPAWRRINYGDWLAQARLAAGGDEAGLRELQASLFRREGDNLRLIRGLGERSAAALQAAGLGTFAALAAASPDEIETVVRGAGARGGDYTAWIDEAGLRAAGKRVSHTARRARESYVVPCPQDLSAVNGVGSVFEQRLYAAGIGSYWELAELPDAELESILGSSADLAGIKAEAMRLAVLSNALGRTWDGTPPDDFEQLTGLGEIYERRLYEAGICTFAALAASTPERLAEICQAPPSRVPDFAAWIARAGELAVGGSD